MFAPGNDSFFKPDLCFGFARSLIGPRVDCKPGGAEQVNYILGILSPNVYYVLLKRKLNTIHIQVNTNTHWLDLSAMYGNDNEELTKKELRGSKDGLMFMGKGNNGVENVPFRNGRICTGDFMNHKKARNIILAYGDSGLAGSCSEKDSADHASDSKKH